MNNEWSFDGYGALRLIPYLLIYLLVEFVFFPKYRKNNKLTQYFAVSISITLLISLTWSFYITPILPKTNHEKNFELQNPKNDEDMLILCAREQDELKLMIDSGKYDSDAVFSKFKQKNNQKKDVPPPPRHQPPIFISLIINLFVFAFFTTMNFIYKMIQTENEKKELEKLKAEAELKMFKYQLNPHFLMNTLNNIHALIELDAEAAQSSVRILSQMMRYMLYESNQEKVELSKELDFLNNYFELMRKRYIDQVDIQYQIPEQIPNVMIPPALLINLVENGFKHGISYLNKSFVHCMITIEPHYVVCNVCNSKAPNATSNNDNGCGLEINMKRLEILYPNQYLYHTDQTDESYHVELKIPTR